MKVLFLDIDGVVNKHENFNPTAKRTMFPLDSYCAFLVGKIKLDTDCEVVLSSAWRLHKDSRQQVKDRVVAIYDTTPMLRTMYDGDKNVTRGEEIRRWLNTHPEVTRYAILDDDSDFYDTQPLFKTTFQDGLTDEIAQKVIEHLNAEEV